MKLRKFLSVGLIVPLASAFTLFNPQQAHAGCGLLDPTCRSGPNDCLFGACPGTGDRDSHIPTQQPNWYRIRYSNASGQVVRELYVSPTLSPSWGGDMLGSGVLRPNWYMDINFNDSHGCMYDLKAVLADGRLAQLRNFNACTVGTVNIR